MRAGRGRRRSSTRSRADGLAVDGPHDGAARTTATRAAGSPRCASWRHALGLRELSMGMTDDFEVAVEEGATMVRVGRALFGAPTALSRCPTPP